MNDASPYKKKGLENTEDPMFVKAEKNSQTWRFGFIVCPAAIPGLKSLKLFLSNLCGCGQDNEQPASFSNPNELQFSTMQKKNKNDTAYNFEESFMFSQIPKQQNINNSSVHINPVLQESKGRHYHAATLPTYNHSFIPLEEEFPLDQSNDEGNPQSPIRFPPQNNSTLAEVGEKEEKHFRIGFQH